MRDRLLFVRRCRSVVVAVAVLLFFSALPAYPGDFEIQPVSIELSRPGEVTLLAVHSLDDHPLRFQVEAYVWEQNPDGTLKLSDTDDILYFPQLFELAPGATQNIRVGTTATPDAVEKTYRIFIEQLPEPATLHKAPTRARTIEVQVAPKVGVPIFLRPPVVTKELTVDNIGVSAGQLGFELRNTGTVHIIPLKIRVEGRGASGTAVFTLEQPGWYVLAGGVRQYRLPIPPSSCGSLREITIRVVTADGQNYEGNAAVAPSACISHRPGSHAR
jgi:fimbrial chaperone protein